MTEKTPDFNFYEEIIEINKKLNNAEDFDNAIKIAVEELQQILDVNRIQIILQRSEQSS